MICIMDFNEGMAGRVDRVLNFILATLFIYIQSVSIIMIIFVIFIPVLV